MKSNLAVELLMYNTLFTVALVVISTCAEDENLIVETFSGKVRGTKERTLEGKEFYSFLGIPFAKPPVGALRFQNPVEADHWTETLDASKYPEKCPQYSIFSLMTSNLVPEGSEDCLHLNIFSSNPNGQLKPVMVFIHGGGFVSGSASEYQPYVLMEEDIVLVVIQYRLNIFGFLSTGDDVMPGNYGLKDQNLALRWIKKNIARFGGDSDNITIFGESAGAASVHLQMLSPYSHGLFKRVISQSGSSLCPWSTNSNPKPTAKQFGESLGCPLDTDGHELDYAECLRNKDSSALLRAYMDLYESALYPLTMVPRIDGDFIPEDPLKIISSQTYNKVDFMTGMVRDEGAFVLFLLSQNENFNREIKEDTNSYAPMAFGFESYPNVKEIATILHDFFTKERPVNPNLNVELAKIFTQSCFGHCYDVTSNLHSRDPDTKVYRYEFNHRGKFSLGDFFQIQETRDWVSHFDDMYYLFEGGELLSRRMQDPEDLNVRKMLVKLWTNFAATGNPTPDDSLGFKWRETESNNNGYLNITLEPTFEFDRRQKIRDLYLSLPLEQNKYLREVFKNKKTEL